MATISNTLKLNDSMTGVLKSVMRSMQMTLSAMENMDRTSSSMDLSRDLSSATAAARQAAAAVAGLEQELNGAAEAAKKPEKNLLNMAKTAAIVTGAIYGIKKAFDAVGAVTSVSDRFTQTTALLNQVNDGLRTTRELQNLIFASANRARSGYQETADLIGRIGLNSGKAFSSTGEIVAFSELINKSFKIGKASIEEQTGAVRQLTQALASGALRGEEFNSIAEGAPQIAQAVEKYMNSAGMNPDNLSLREMAAEGMISASILKNAMFDAADDINAKFSQTPQTWESATTQMKNTALKNFIPVLERINQLANSERFQQMTASITMGFARMAGFALTVINLLVGGAALIYDNWSWLAPIILGVAAAVGVYALAVNGAKIAEMAQAAWTGITTTAKVIAAGVTMALTGATAAQTAAQWGLNAALLACPLTWIIILVIALIAIFFAVIAAINHFSGTSISAIGVITGAFATAAAFIANLLMGLLQIVFGIIEYWYNGFAAVANFLGNVFNDPIASVINLFAALADNVLGVLEKIASAMDFLFGSNFAATVSGWRSNLAGMAENAVAKYGNGTYKERVGDLDINSALEDLGLGMERFSYSDSYNAGYNWGKGIDDKLSGISDNLGGIGDDITDRSQYGGESFGDTPDIGRVGSVGRIEDDVTISDEDIKMLKDLAARDYQLNLTQLTPKMSVQFGDIRETADAGAILEFIEDSVVEALHSSLVVKR